jgi:single-strand DNA-binding protein
MAININRKEILGNVGMQPEITVGKNDTQKAKLTVATNRYYKDKNDEWVEQVTWHNVTVFGPLVGKVEKINKGDMVYVAGPDESYEYTDDDGNKQRYKYLKANEIQFVSRQENNDDSYAKAAPDASAQATEDDDVPF